MPDIGSSVAEGAAAGSVVPGVGTAIGAGLGLLTGGLEFFSSAAKKRKEEAELASIRDPFYKIQDEFYQNRNLAGQQAESGMPSATKDYLTSETGRGLSAGIGGVLQGGGDINDINKLFDTYNKSIDKTAAEDAEMHAKNIDYFMNANKDLAGEKIKQWSLNKYKPIQERKKQLSENIAADQQSENNAINTALGSFSALTTGNENNSLIDQLFKKRSSGTDNNLRGLSWADPIQSSEPAMVNSTGYINPNVNLTPN